MDRYDFEYVQLDRSGRVVATEPGSVGISRSSLPGGIALEMVFVPGGTFTMGSQPGQGYPDESPKHQVRVSSFLLARNLITQAQWASVMDWAPPFRNHGPDLPVDRVNRNEAQSLCSRLAAATGLAFRLPTEAEWEYACRAGTSSAFSFGPTVTTEVCNFVGLHRYADEPTGEYRHASNVGTAFPPNPFGLSDMHGNLWEWCADQWHDDYNGAPDDGGAWGEPSRLGFGVVRGGSWHEPPQNCRSATRLRFAVDEADDVVGVRVALAAEAI